jgi:uncharacterized SAM-binding protein YcdF (DUF218 family)
MVKALVWTLAGAIAAGLAAVGVTYDTAPRGNTSQTHFDAVIMLGFPANSDGTPSPEQRERVIEAVREVKRGRAAHLIVTGGAAHNNWVEADVEAKLAEQLGVPAEEVVEERWSRNTIENVGNVWQIMQARGWTSAEVVSSDSHLPRAALILRRFDAQGLKWQMDAAKWPKEYSFVRIGAMYWHEAFQTTKLRWFGFGRSKK